MLLYQGESETGAAAGTPTPRGARATRESLEDAVAIRRRYPRPGVVDEHPDEMVAGLDDDLGRPAGVALGVLDQIHEDAFDPALVDDEFAMVVLGVDLHRHRRVPGGGDRVPDELADLDRGRREIGRSGVETGDLEQVPHHALETADFGSEQVEGALGAFGEFFAPRLDHRQRGCQGRQGRTELMTDVGGETGVPVDPLLQPIRHSIERRGQRGEVAGVDGLESRVEHPARDRRCRFGDVA